MSLVGGRQGEGALRFSEGRVRSPRPGASTAWAGFDRRRTLWAASSRHARLSTDSARAESIHGESAGHALRVPSKQDRDNFLTALRVLPSGEVPHDNDPAHPRELLHLIVCLRDRQQPNTAARPE